MQATTPALSRAARSFGGLLIPLIIHSLLELRESVTPVTAVPHTSLFLKHYFGAIFSQDSFQLHVVKRCAGDLQFVSSVLGWRQRVILFKLDRFLSGRRCVGFRVAT